MSPWVEAGARARVEKRSIYLPGDVIVFRSSSDFVAHRLLGYAPVAGRLGFVTKGDHCPRHDGVVPGDRVVGRLVTPVPIRARLAAIGTLVALVARRLVGRA